MASSSIDTTALSTSASTTTSNDYGLHLLDRSSFTQRIPCRALRVPCRKVASIVTNLRSSILKVSKVKPVITDQSSKEYRLILLGTHLKEGLDGLDEQQSKSIQPMLTSGEIAEVSSAYELDYARMTASEVFRQIIPNVKEHPASFETAGHVAHINLRSELLPYKRLIGQVLLDKNVHITTVVNKTSTIASEFRTFPMELIAGIDNTAVQVKEMGVKFQFDFRQVYWNSRLQHEHEYIVKSIEKHHVVCDMMAGIGPFAIPAAKHKQALVYANDLNPKSYEYLMKNSKLNKVEKNLHGYNMCGREFVRELISKQIQFDIVLMNLPATAIEFLDVFVGLLRGAQEWWQRGAPLVHTYCFSSAVDRKQDVLERVAVVLKCSVDDLVDASVREVRDVAPNKWMMCVSFRVPNEVLFGPTRKKRRTEDYSTSVSS